jgi:flagellar operon protein
MSISELYRIGGGPGGVAPQEKPGIDKKIQTETDFKKVFDQELLHKQEATENALRFSNHAQARIQSRSIPWDVEMEKRVLSGIEAAGSKGSREALILAGGIAFIANVKSKTIITAMDSEQLKQKVFTNIDSTVLV